MKLRSEISIVPSSIRHGHSEPCVALGSCFASEMGQRLRESLIPSCVNPLGTAFNPIALGRMLRRALHKEPFLEEELFHHQELWRHFDVHSALACVDPASSLRSANTQLDLLASSLNQASWIILTLGTAWSYWHRASACDVGHNHKLPLAAFEKRLLAPEEIAEHLSAPLSTLLERKPQLQIILTVSPVRHLRDGFHENTLSKSTLQLATHQLQQRFPTIAYFPAYEILLDDLRDYRFYASDLTHPSEAAIELIWQRFQEAYLDQETQGLCEEIKQLRTSLHHRPLHRDTQQYQDFKAKQSLSIAALEQRGLDCSELWQLYAKEA